VARVKPDGYTVGGLTNGSLVIAPNINPAVTYRYTDFLPIGIISLDYVILAGKAGGRWKSLEDLVNYAKMNPGKLNCGSPGQGSTSYFALELLKNSYGIDIVPVQFQGTAPVNNALLGGHTDLAIGTLSTFIPLIRSGDIVPFVSTAPRRLDLLPNVPTMGEKGFHEVCNAWTGIFVPRACGKSIVEKLAPTIESVMKDSAVIQQYEKAGIIVYHLGPEASLKLIQDENKMVANVAKKLGIGEK
jgi:tripartite-type tricarboxylate transporter receptor subunit TctC